MNNSQTESGQHDFSYNYSVIPQFLMLRLLDLIALAFSTNVEHCPTGITSTSLIDHFVKPGGSLKGMFMFIKPWMSSNTT